jgi:hypothetical protein
MKYWRGIPENLLRYSKYDWLTESEIGQYRQARDIGDTEEMSRLRDMAFYRYYEAKRVYPISVDELKPEYSRLKKSRQLVYDTPRIRSFDGIPVPGRANPANTAFLFNAGSHRRKEHELNREWFSLPWPEKNLRITRLKQIRSEPYPRIGE